RSFDYAAYAALLGFTSGRGRATGVVRDQDRPALYPWSRAWRGWTRHAFLQAYLEGCGAASFIPPSGEERDVLFRVLLYEKLLIEIAYELSVRPAWLDIPLAGLGELFTKPEMIPSLSEKL